MESASSIAEGPDTVCRAAITASLSGASILAQAAALMPRRMLPTLDAMSTAIFTWCMDLAALSRVGAAACRAAACDADKALETQAECKRVRAAQLAAYAHLLEEGNDTVAGLALQLLAQEHDVNANHFHTHTFPALSLLDTPLPARAYASWSPATWQRRARACSTP